MATKKDKSGIHNQKKTGKSVGMKIKTAPMPSQFLKKSGGRGAIEIGKYNTSKWTTKNYVIAVSLLAIPYIGMLIYLYSAGVTFLVYILLGVAVLSALLAALAYWVDKADL